MPRARHGARSAHTIPLYVHATDRPHRHSRRIRTAASRWHDPPQHCKESRLDLGSGSTGQLGQELRGALRSAKPAYPPVLIQMRANNEMSVSQELLPNQQALDRVSCAVQCVDYSHHSSSPADKLASRSTATNTRVASASAPYPNL